MILRIKIKKTNIYIYIYIYSDLGHGLGEAVYGARGAAGPTEARAQGGAHEPELSCAACRVFGLAAEMIARLLLQLYK